TNSRCMAAILGGHAAKGNQNRLTTNVPLAGLEHRLVQSPELNAAVANASYGSQSFSLGVKHWMLQEAANALCRFLIAHVEVNECVVGVTERLFEKVLIMGE